MSIFKKKMRHHFPAGKLSLSERELALKLMDKVILQLTSEKPFPIIEDWEEVDKLKHKIAINGCLTDLESRQLNYMVNEHKLRISLF